jgi:Ala-tRNA(Pro) deacylase
MMKRRLAMPIPKEITSYLDEHRVPYETIHHRRDFTAQETAADTHTKGKEFAKTIVLFIDDRYYLAVLPAHRQVSLSKIKDGLHAKNVALASEDEISSIFNNCETGAMPPLGELYNLPVYVDDEIHRDYQITFNAGTHEDVIRMLYKDYQALVHPKVMDITTN